MNDVNGAHCCCSMAAMLRHTYTAYFINWMSDCYTLLKQDCFAWSYTTLVCPSVCRSIGRFIGRFAGLSVGLPDRPFCGLSVGLPAYRSVCRSVRSCPADRRQAFYPTRLEPTPEYRNPEISERLLSTVFFTPTCTLASLPQLILQCSL